MNALCGRSNLIARKVLHTTTTALRVRAYARLLKPIGEQGMFESLQLVGLMKSRGCFGELK